MRYLEAKFLLSPIIVLGIIGYFLFTCQFVHFGSYIIGCATLMSASVAIYISRKREYLDENRKNENRSLLLSHLVTIIQKGTDSLTNEIQNYRDFIKDIKKNGMGQSSLKTTPLYFLESASNDFNDKMFDAILNLSHLDQNQARENYLEIVSNVRNAMFIRENAHSQYKNFIESYNEKANKLPHVFFKLNEISQKTRRDSSVSELFRKGLAQIIFEFNEKVESQIVSFYSFKVHRELVISPLRDLLSRIKNTSKYHGELASLIREYEMVIDKMEQIQEIVIEHFTELANSLEDIQKMLDEKIDLLEE